MGENHPNSEAEHDAINPATPDELAKAYAGRPGDLEAGASIFEQLVTPATRARVLDVLLVEPGEAWTITEIAQQNDRLSVSSISREKDALLDAGVIVTAGKKGNAQTYQLNFGHPVAELLRMLTATTTWGKTPALLDEHWIAEDSQDPANAQRESASPVDRIETVRVALPDLREAYAWNRKHPNKQRERVLRIHPPFSRTVEATLYTDKEGNYDPPEQTPTPIHLAPAAFVDESQLPEWPTRTAQRQLIKQDDNVELTEDSVEEGLQTARDVFWAEFGSALADSVDLKGTSPRESRSVDVEYTGTSSTGE